MQELFLQMLFLQELFLYMYFLLRTLKAFQVEDVLLSTSTILSLPMRKFVRTLEESNSQTLTLQNHTLLLLILLL